ncbi:hypothetical protein ACVW00_003010 [Marmoricola sp. URHA0025 HA25]
MTSDLHDDLTVQIAQELQREGTCVRVVRSIPRQRVVDVSWAARRAGRLIGERVHTSVTPLSPRSDGEVAIVVVVDTDPVPAPHHAPPRVPQQRS